MYAVSRGLHYDKTCTLHIIDEVRRLILCTALVTPIRTKISKSRDTTPFAGRSLVGAADVALVLYMHVHSYLILRQSPRLGYSPFPVHQLARSQKPEAEFQVHENAIDISFSQLTSRTTISRSKLHHLPYRSKVPVSCVKRHL